MVRFYGKNLTLILPFSYLFNIPCILIYYNILYIKKNIPYQSYHFPKPPILFQAVLSRDRAFARNTS